MKPTTQRNFINKNIYDTNKPQKEKENLTKKNISKPMPIKVNKPNQRTSSLSLSSGFDGWKKISGEENSVSKSSNIISRIIQSYE
jgi:hypothetical protein